MRRITERTPVKFVSEFINDFIQDDCMSLAAAVAYYTTFSIAPLLVIVITLVAFVLQRMGMADDTGQVQTQIVQQIRSTIGEQPATQVAKMVSEAAKPGKSIAATTTSVVVLIFGATAIFAQIQLALNRVWGVAPDPKKGGVKMFIRKRLLSFGLVLSVAFLLLTSLVLSVLIEAAGNCVNRYFGLNLDSWLPTLMHAALNILVITLVFALMLKFLPDARIRWRDVWIGSILTSVLFAGGRYLISLYLATSDFASGFGAASSLVLLLIWIYYSSLIFLFGAEFTQTWSRYRGHRIIPERGAIAIIKIPQPVSHHPAM